MGGPLKWQMVDVLVECSLTTECGMNLGRWRTGRAAEVSPDSLLREAFAAHPLPHHVAEILQATFAQGMVVVHQSFVWNVARVRPCCRASVVVIRREKFA